MNEKELTQIFAEADCEALREGIKKGRDFVLPIKGEATIHFIFSAPFVRLDFMKVTDGDILTQRAILKLEDLDELVNHLQMIQMMKVMGWEV